MAVAIPIPTKLQALAELVRLTRAAGAPLPSNEIPFVLENALLLHHLGGIQSSARGGRRSFPIRRIIACGVRRT